MIKKGDTVEVIDTHYARIRNLVGIIAKVRTVFRDGDDMFLELATPQKIVVHPSRVRKIEDDNEK